MKNISEYFGTNLFDGRVMREKLSPEIFRSLQETINEGKDLDVNVANAVAAAMRDWAVENGATHYTHWFQPLNGFTAEKHDSFITPAPEGGVIMEFSGKELIKGEPDASSFPSGGLRATFEARGYTAWDPTSYAFIKDKTLCIPTAFCSYGGHALDKKTPLLRSMQAIDLQARRVLALFGVTDVKKVTTAVGAEQEYFLIDKQDYLRREDLICTGRTLFGAEPPKGQQMDDHYFGVIKPRVLEFMQDLDEELWKLGVYAKTEHNEVAPGQHELAPIYTTANISTDQNQIMMEMMKKVADRHDLVCLLHEKPFEGVNGSGKHNNWSLSTDQGMNLLKPGRTPYENAQFLTFLVAIIAAVDEYADLLRASVASAGNDHRLGGSEAPPAVISVYLGEELTEILDAIESDTPYSGMTRTVMKLGVSSLPEFTKDATDRNRTSPFAFTGNKFEFRMVGSSDSIADANTFLNTAVAEELRKIADLLEHSDDFDADLHEMLKGLIRRHRRIIFNGNGYDDNWKEEAVTKRGLRDLRTTPDCIPALTTFKSIDLFSTHRVLSEDELRSREEIALENYTKTIAIEARTMIDMANKLILPAVSAYTAELCTSLTVKLSAVSDIDCDYERSVARKLAAANGEIHRNTYELKKNLKKLSCMEYGLGSAEYVRDSVIPVMENLRKAADEAESITAKDYWPFPTYADLLFGEI